MAARDDLGARRRRSRRARRSSCGPHDADEVAGGAARLQRRARSRHRGRGPQRRVRRERARCSAACCSTSPALAGHRRRRHGRRCSSTCCRARSATCSRTSCAREHGVTCGHWPQSMALSTVGGWLACRGAGQLSTRYGKIEDIVAGLDVVLADGTLITTGGAPRAAVGPDLTQLFVGSEGTLGVIVGARLRAHRLPAAEVRGRVRVRVVRRRARRDAPHRAARRDARGAAALRRDRGRPQLPDRRRARAARARRGRRARRRRDAPHRRRGVRGRRDRARRRPRRAVDATPQRRLGARGADLAGASSSTRWRSPASWRALPAVYARATAAIRARRAHDGRVGAPEPLVPRRRVPLLHVRRPAARSRRARRYYRAAWDAGQRAVLDGGRRAQPPPRRRPEPGPLRRRRARRGLRRAAIGEGRPRPERHPQPGQARAARARSARSPGRERRARPRARRRRRHEQRPRRRRSTADGATVHDGRTGAAPRLARRRARRVRRRA